MRFWMGSQHPHGWWWPWRGPEPVLFGIHEASAKEILRSVSNNLEAVPEIVAIAVAPITDELEPDRDLDIAIQGDGLALFQFPPPPVEHRRWDLWKGDWA